MISVKKLLYELDMRLNKIATLEHQSIPYEDKIIVLNKAQLNLIKKKIDVNNIYRLGLDAFKKRYEDLQKLIVQAEKANVTKDEAVYQSFVVNTADLKNKYMFLLNVEAICSKGGCTSRPVTSIKIAKHADLPVLMDNSNYSPSFEYQETLTLVAADKIHIYTDKTFTVDYAYISYLRYPQMMDIEGYIDLDGNPSVTRDCELAEYLEDELLDLAVMELASNTENYPSIQTTDLRLKSNE